MRARLGVPRLFLALVLALSGPAITQAKPEPADHSPSVIQQATTADTFLPANDVKPCVRKPDNLASASFVNASESGGKSEREPHSVVLPGGANARSLSLASSGGGRAPPSVTLA
jgi:hypothetical protein